MNAPENTGGIARNISATLQGLQAENEQLRAGYDAARQEIASLRAQLKAVAALVRPRQCLGKTSPSYLIDHCEGDTISEEGLQFALSKMLSDPQYAPQPVAQAMEADELFVRFAAQAVAAEREACAQLAEQTVCDLHIPTGIKIYGTKAGKAIRERDKPIT